MGVSIVQASHSIFNVADIRWGKPLMRRWSLHWVLRFLRRVIWESRWIKCVFSLENDRFSTGPCFLKKMGFTNYLCCGPKWSLLNGRPFDPSLTVMLGLFREWGFLGLPFRAKVFGVDLGPLPIHKYSLNLFYPLTILYHTHTFPSQPNKA